MRSRDKKTICIIPARGGSKSIHMKNIKLLNGKPLIHYTLKTAIESKIFDKIVVTSDSLKILNIASKYKDVELIKRPKKLSLDRSLTEPTLLHVCDVMKSKHNYIPDIVFTLEPTAPLRSIKTIKACLKIISSKDVDSVVGITETKKCIGKIVNKRFKYFIKNQPRRRQDREKMYYESGTIYATKLATLVKYGSVLGKRLYPVVVPSNEAFDVNEILDFNIIEAIMKNNYTNE